MLKRDFLRNGSASLVLGAIGLGIVPRFAAPARAAASDADFPVMKSDAQWRTQLSPQAYSILRQQGTERAFTSALNDEHRPGMFHCAGCDNAVYNSETKFDSGTGWPSFWQAVSGAIGTHEDRALMMLRVECHCARCGGHLGHIFDDGPKPTGKRHCINGVAMTFKPA